MEKDQTSLEYILRKIVREEVSAALDGLLERILDHPLHSLSEYPDVLNVNHVSEIIGISKARVYELTRQEDFPKIVIGKRIVIPKDQFRLWMKQSRKYDLKME